MSNHQAWRPPDYAERGVLIAGGTSGVGLATAMAFASAAPPAGACRPQHRAG